jgi:hypothetical protein
MDPDFRRFQQKVRSGVRAYVREQREAPPLSLWASEGRNPRRVLRVAVGAAEDALDVRARIVGGIRERGSRFAAVGGLAQARADGAMDVYLPTNVLSVVFASADELVALEVEARAGRLGVWRGTRISSAAGESMVDSWFFLQQAIRGAEKERAGDA